MRRKQSILRNITNLLKNLKVVISVISMFIGFAIIGIGIGSELLLPTFIRI